MNGVFLLPTRGRVQNLRRFVNSAREHGTSEKGWVLVNPEDFEAYKSEYELAKRLFPPGWEYKIVPGETYGDTLRNVWDDVKDLDWVGLVSDDLVPSTSIWDKQLISGLQGWNFISTNDGWQANQNINQSRMHGATVWSGDLLRAVGWIFPPKLKHIFHDDVWESIGRTTGSWQMRMDIMCRHLHEALQGVRGPTMDPASDLWKHDEAVFKDWKEKEFASVCERVVTNMQRFNIQTKQVDFKGISLMIGTPTIDGKYESAYVASLYKTFAMFQANGAHCVLAEEKYTADISFARSNIFMAFVRSAATHLLMIDADMGWDENAILRLLCAKKDFVAIAGPKKRYPLQFAANYTDDHGNPIQLQFDQETGTMEIGEIGAAFTMISRRCAETLVRSYPELEYKDVTGDRAWGLFMPMIVKKRWFSEDFAFCKRWRLLGEHCYLIPDVALSHTGSHTFQGAFSQTAVPAQAKEAAD